MLCLCITMAEYVNPFYLFPTWDQLFTRADSVVGQVGELFGVELDLFPEKNDDPTQIVTQSTVEVHMIDVGQADAILIQAPEANVLIDAGENGCGEQVVAYLKAQGVSYLDLVIGTHAHSDHIGGMDVVLEEIKTGRIILSDIPEESIPSALSYTKLLKTILEEDMSITEPNIGDTYSLGDGAKLQIVGPAGLFTDLNNTSVVCRLTYGEHAFLFTGDCEEQGEASILNRRGLDLSAGVLKVGHHGADTSTSDAFLLAVDPDIALISAGSGNDYGHPHQSVTQKLVYSGAEIYRTDICGDIVVTSDGKTLRVDTEK
jgi:competence protein ComEC